MIEVVSWWSLYIVQLLSKGSFPIIVAGRYHNKLVEIAEIATTFDHGQNFTLLQSKLNSSPPQKYDTIPNDITYLRCLRPSLVENSMTSVVKAKVMIKINVRQCGLAKGPLEKGRH